MLNKPTALVAVAVLTSFIIGTAAYLRLASHVRAVEESTFKVAADVGRLLMRPTEPVRLAPPAVPTPPSPSPTSASSTKVTTDRAISTDVLRLLCFASNRVDLKGYSEADQHEFQRLYNSYCADNFGVY